MEVEGERGRVGSLIGDNRDAIWYLDFWVVGMGSAQRSGLVWYCYTPFTSGEMGVVFY